MELDCRNKRKLENGCTCVLKNGMFFDLLAPDGTLLVQCLNAAKVFRCPVFKDAHGRELGRIRFKWTTPVLVLADNEGGVSNREVELKLFRDLGREFLSFAEIKLFGTKIICRDGHLSVDDNDLPADKQNLIQAILCFCQQYRQQQEKEHKVCLYLMIILFIILCIAMH